MSALSTHLLDRDRTADQAPRRAPEPGAPGSVDAGPGAPSAVVLPTAERLNWLRAGVLGANDGIVSVAA
ncbi:MAG: hypothetical protein ABW025_00770, partial [Cellulomonas sp.]